MSDITQSKAALTSELTKTFENHPSLPLSFSILDAMLTILSSELEMMSFVSFQNLLHDPVSAEDLHAALTILFVAGLLEKDFLLIDDDSEEYSVSKEEMATAEVSGFLIHPNLGVPIVNYEKLVVTFYRASDDLRSMQAMDMAI